MTEFYKSSLIDITDDITIDSPSCVIDLMLTCHHNFQKGTLDKIAKIATLNKTRGRIIQRDDLGDRTIALLINPSEQSWKKRNLIIAYEFLISLNRDNYQMLMYKCDGFFMQTNEFPKALGLISCYSICMWNNIRLYRDTTEDSIYSIAKSLVNGCNYLMNCITNYLSLLGHNDLMGITAHIPLKGTLPQVKEEMLISIDNREERSNILDSDKIIQLGTTISEIGSMTWIAKKTVINDESEAAMMAAIISHIDITNSECPIDELSMIMNSQIKNYIPICDKFRRLRSINKWRYDLRTQFNPIFNITIYPDIIELCKLEGKICHRKEEAWMYLELSYLTETFYLGRTDKPINTETMLELLDIDTLDAQYVLCYGVMGSPMHVTTLAEMKEVFRNNMNFVNPFCRNSIFTDVAINKLMAICESSYDSPTELVVASRVELKNILESIKEMEGLIPIIINRYKKSPNNVKSNFVRLLTIMMEIGMRMRGWTGIGSYPLTSKECIIIPEVVESIELSICQSINNFYVEEQEQHMQEVNDVLDLPLVRYVDNKYVSSNGNRGLTIRERLDKVLDRANNPVDGCIRTSSNYIVSSCYLYLTQLSHRPQFDINKLSSIA